MDSLGPFWDLGLRLAAALVLGGVVGLEREYRHKAAGLRTHMIVSLGSATFTITGLELYRQVDLLGIEVTRMDPLRIVQGVIGGIGFLGAGTIIRSRGSIEGLTTAASLWMVGAVGVAAGGGHYAIAVLSVVLGLLILSGVGFIEGKIRRDTAGR